MSPNLFSLQLLCQCKHLKCYFIPTFTLWEPADDTSSPWFLRCPGELRLRARGSASQCPRVSPWRSASKLVTHSSRGKARDAAPACLCESGKKCMNGVLVKPEWPLRTWRFVSDHYQLRSGTSGFSSHDIIGATER